MTWDSQRCDERDRTVRAGDASGDLREVLRGEAFAELVGEDGGACRVGCVQICKKEEVCEGRLTDGDPEDVPEITDEDEEGKGLAGERGREGCEDGEDGCGEEEADADGEWNGALFQFVSVGNMGRMSIVGRHTEVPIISWPSPRR